MNTKTLHIVSLDVPFPPDYGGMIDVFYRIKALHELGFSIILHCFTYGRGEPEELKQYCKEVHFYKREKRISDFFSKKPFIVQTRMNEELLERLLADKFPILLEGIHCCWYLENPAIQKRTTLLRSHNIEHDYYIGLKNNSSGLKRFYYSQEAKKLERYEQIVANAKYILSIKKSDVAYFRAWNENTFLLPASAPEFDINEDAPLKEYCLFHGNLSVSENDISAKWLLEHVIPALKDISFIIAGKNPRDSLRKLAEKKQVELIENPDQETMRQLIVEAKVHVLHSTNDAGLKLKLYEVLQTMGSVIVNSNMVKGNDLEKYCVVADTPTDFISAVQNAFDKEPNIEESKNRIQLFKSQTDTKEALSHIINKVFHI